MKTKKWFTNKRLLQLVKEFNENGIRGVVLIGGGEPLAHPAIGEFIDCLGEHDIHIGITTNGTFVRKYLDQIAKYSNWIRVSMDAATSRTFGILRPSKSGQSKFDDIVVNMRMLAKKKRNKLGYSYLIRTEADGVPIESNINEIFQAAELARDIGCDYFEVKPSYQYREGIDHSLTQHDPRLMQLAREEILRLDELETDSFAILKAINLQYSLKGAQFKQSKGYTTCPVAELRTLICPSGVFVCPYWRGKEHMRIGDLNDKSLFEMWNGERRKYVMNRLNPGTHCWFHCLRHESNLEIINIRESISKGEHIDIVDEFDRFI